MALSAEIQAVIDSGNIPVIGFAEFDFASGFLRVHSGAQNSQVEWNGQTWLGVGGYGKVTPIRENSSLEVYDMQLALTGIDPALIATALSEDYFGRTVKVWFGVLDEKHRIIDSVDNPFGPFSGRMDTIEGDLGEYGTLVVTAKNKLADWSKPRSIRYTNARQQAEYPGDLGMEYVTQTVEKELVW